MYIILYMYYYKITYIFYSSNLDDQTYDTIEQIANSELPLDYNNLVMSKSIPHKVYIKNIKNFLKYIFDRIN